jgi:hypothetical protein
MRQAMTISCAGIVLMTAVTAWAAAQPRDCTSIESPEARLACYDRQHGREGAPAPARPVPAPEAPAAATAPTPAAPDAPPPAPEADATADAPAAAARAAPGDPGAFGREQLPQPARPPEAPDALTAEVTGVGQGMTGRRWFRLDNGQLWEQVTARRTGIEPGDRVALTRSPIGTYHLRRADGSSRSTQVRRRE